MALDRSVAAFREAMGRLPGRTGRMAVPTQKAAAPLPREALDQYWHPDRPGVEQAPADFRRELAAMHEDLACVRPPGRAPLLYKRRAWLVWYRMPRVTHPLSPGWWLLFPWESPWHEALPLDNRVFANLYLRSRKLFPNAVQYFDKCMADVEREKQAREKSVRAETGARGRELYGFHQIKNIGRGNKFALHHDGTIVPSRGEQDWLRDLNRYRHTRELLKDRKS